MKVFGCRNQKSFGGGLVLVAANTKEEAYLLAAMNEELSYLFEWEIDDEWCEPDGNIDHCISKLILLVNGLRQNIYLQT